MQDRLREQTGVISCLAFVGVAMGCPITIRHGVTGPNQPGAS